MSKTKYKTMILYAGDNHIDVNLAEVLNKEQPNSYQLTPTQYGHTILVMEFKPTPKEKGKHE